MVVKANYALEHTPLPGRNKPIITNNFAHPTLAALFGGMGLLI